MDPRHDHSDEDLLAIARAEPWAFGVFYRRHDVAVLAYVRRRTGRADLAADVTAEVFAAALESAPRFRPDRGTAVAWLYGIAHHKVADAVRTGVAEDRARRRLGMVRLAVSDDDIERIDALASVEGLGAALEQLSGAERHALRARVVHERSYADIAGELGASPLVVRKRVSRALSRLRSILGATR